MNPLTTFDFNSNSIRVVTLDGAPWFVAADVCRVLGLTMASGTHRYLGKLAKDEKRILTSADVPNSGLGRSPTAAVVSESGLYKLVMRSDKPQARAFQDWVTRVVLPAIRKDGRGTKSPPLVSCSLRSGFKSGRRAALRPSRRTSRGHPAGRPSSRRLGSA